MITLNWRICSRWPGSRNVVDVEPRRVDDADAQRADGHAVLLGRVRRRR